MAKNGSTYAYARLSQDLENDPPVSSKKKLTQRQQTARTLCDFYNARLRIAVNRFSTHTLHLRSFDQLIASQQKIFLAAASSCMEIGADPKLFVVAQFECFLTYVRASKRQRYFPQPCHLVGPGAQARFYENEQRKEESNFSFAKSKPAQQKEFFREERKLRGLTRIYRQPESEILLAHPTEFTQLFLEHRGVWPLVRDEYEAEFVS